MTNTDRDAITSEATLVREADGGQRYEIGGAHLVVLNGTHEQMGQQYGALLKDELHATLENWRKIYIESGTLTIGSVEEAIGRPCYRAAPKTLKDMYNGIADGSGITVEQAVVLDGWIDVAFLGRRAGCSSGIGWGSKTKDGSAWIGRNFDFPEFAGDIMGEFGVVVVMNPLGGQHSLIGVGPAGTISGFSDLMNSAGMHVQYNNGAGSVGPVMYSNRQSVLTFMRNNLLEYSTIEELEVVFNTSKANYPLLMGVCESHRGTHFELSPETYTSKPLHEDYSYRANQFLSPDWGIPVLPDPAGWYSVTRGAVWDKFLKERSGDLNANTLMQIMKQDMYNDDATLTKTGFTVFEPPENMGTEGGAEGGDVTILQVIAHPIELKWWVRMPTHTVWLEIDCKKYFAN